MSSPSSMPTAQADPAFHGTRPPEVCDPSHTEEAPPPGRGIGKLLCRPRIWTFALLLLATLVPTTALEVLHGAAGALPVYVCVLALAVAISAALAAALQPGARAAARGPVSDALPALTPPDRRPLASPAHSAQRQQEAMTALSAIDHAILSRANRDRIVEMVLRNARPIIGADVLGIAVLGSTPETVMRVSVRGQKSPLASCRTTIEAEELEFLSTETNGCWIDDLEAYPWLSPLANCGARRVLLLPVFVDAKLTAVISIGLTEHDDLPDDARTYARDFADRLGVALTAAARDEHLYVESHFDPVTALPNRRFLKDRISEEISRAHREHRKLAVIFINLDEFKKVNAVGGLAGGDAVLQQAARRLKRCLREEDVLGRFSGDEFVALLPTVPSGLEAGKVAGKLLALLTQPFTLGSHQYHLGASMGICVYPDDGDGADKLLRNANSAMARAKSNGRGQYVFFEEQLNALVHERTTMEHEIRHGIGNNELVVFYQPQIELRTGKLVAAEALLRWQHPERGIVPPDKFIGVCEQSKLIDLIGEHVRAAVGVQYGAWERSGMPVTRVSVNVSSREIKRREFVAQVETMLRETGIRPFCLELEITESVLVDKSANVLDSLKQLHDKGVRIAIDDFGTGFSSLSYLKQLPFDVLKIDRAFTKGIGMNDGSDEIVSAIVGMAHSLGKEVVAEGVETDEQLLFLVQKGCEVGQGYLWSKPLSAGDFEALARDWKPEPQQRVLRGVAAKKVLRQATR